MLRRLLATLAIITGLAAAGAPAHAQLSSSSVSEMVAFGDTDRERKEEECRDARKRIARGDKTALPKGCRPLKPVTIYIPTVQIGIDRAAK